MKRNHGLTSTRKKIAISTWKAPEDPSLFGNLEFDCEKIDNFLNSYNKKNPEAKLTYTHFFMKVMGVGFTKSPTINGTIAFGNFIPFEGVHVSTLVDVEGKNLVSVTVNDCDSLSLPEIRKKANGNIKKMKMKKDENVKEQMKLINLLPTPIVSCVVQISSFVSYFLGKDFKPLKLKKYQFGNILVTNISSIDLDFAFAPLTNFTGAVMVVVICKPKEKIVVNEKKELVVRKMININITVDHRYGEGATLEPIIQEMYRLVDNPHEML